MTRLAWIRQKSMELRRRIVDTKVAALEERRRAYDELDWQYHELGDLIADLRGHHVSVFYVRPASLETFINQLPSVK